MEPKLHPRAFKKSFCRFYLRGLCIFTSKQCTFSHGVHDLHYEHMGQGQVVEYNYLQDTDFTQKKAVKGPRVYVNLFEFNQKYTLKELNQDRTKRSEIRKEMHQRLFEEFMTLLQITYLGLEFTDKFLIQQYTRAGFNKLMTRIKFSHLTDHLCQQPNSKYFKATFNQCQIIKRKANSDQIDNYYRELYAKSLKEANCNLEESQIKKIMFETEKTDSTIPPLNVILKQKKTSFSDYLQSLNEDTKGIILQTSPEAMLKEAVQYIEQNLSTKIIDWGSVYKHLSKQFKCNNGNIINQVKSLLVLEGYLFLFFPMVQLIINPNNQFKLINEMSCQCKLKQKYELPEIIMSNLEPTQSLGEGSIDIFDIESLLMCAPYLLRSKYLGVDLEGKLRKNGYIEMIQLNNGFNTFLIDIYQMDLNGDIQAFTLTKMILRNIMMDQNILKIFHDCRHDSLALHEFACTCVRNVFDTSATETYFGQIELYAVLGIKQTNPDQKQTHTNKDNLKAALAALASATAVKTPGLNEILKRYNATHGINEGKDRFHKMWAEGKTSLFDQRPLDKDYRQYCIKDVLDLPQIYQKMSKRPNADLQLSFWISSQYVRQGYQSTQA